MIATLVTLLLTLGQAPAISKAASEIEELNRLEAAWNDAHVRGDAEALDALWANDLIVTVAGMRVTNKADSLAMVRSGRMPFLRYETSDLRVRNLDGSALVTGCVVRERSMNGKSLMDDWRFTKVYVRSQGRWQVIAWHASPSAP